MWCTLAVADDDLHVPLLAALDPNGKVAERFGVRGEHAVFVLDAHGIVRWTHVGSIGTADTAALIAALTPPVVPSEAKDPLFPSPTRREFVATTLAAALLGEPCGPADADVRECMSGNICRCGAYPGSCGVSSKHCERPARAQLRRWHDSRAALSA